LQSISAAQRAQLAQDTLYYLTTTSYSLGLFDNALSYCEQLLRQVPDSSQFASLHRAVQYRFREEEDQKKEVNDVHVGVGMTILVAGAIGLSLLLSRKR
jgi:hypothetical protein